MPIPRSRDMEPEQPNLRQGLFDMGMDSLMAVRIRNAARVDFGIEPPVALLLQGASLMDVVTDLVLQLGLETDSVGHDVPQKSDAVRDRARQRAAARQDASVRRARGQRV